MKKLLSASWAAKYDDVAWLFLRIATGLIFTMHGYQKWQNGLGPTTKYVASLGFPLPELFAVLLIAAELAGGIALIVGAYTRHAAAANIVVAFVAVLVHADRGFFVREGGYEFALLLLAATLLVFVRGGGKWSLDRQWLKLP